MSFYKRIVFPLLTRYDAEAIHYRVTNALKFIYSLPLASFILNGFFSVKNKKLEREIFGLKFPNPVGLAAGFDKNASFVDELATMGFGFIEIGTLTPRPQMGNDKPRLFRLKLDNALINRMGFNNEGSKAAAERLKKRQSKIIIGGNIGRNKNTDNDEAVYDYIAAMTDLYDVVNYFVVNVSSPNTPNLRELQEKGQLTFLLKSIQKENEQLAISRQQAPKPVLLKIAPDLTNNQLDDIIDIIKITQIAGLIASNTTISREHLQTDINTIQEIGAGGLSGRPLKDRSTAIIKYLSEKSNKAFPIIGVGGIHSPADAIEKLEAGASLIQIYSGFIYEGPSLAKEICKEILRKSEKTQ